MKILVFSWRDIKHPLAGGAEQVMHEHAKGWIKSGHRVMCFAARFPGCKSEEEVDGVQILRRSHQFLGVQLAGFLYYLKNKTEIDFVVDEFHGIPFFTPLYVRKPRLAVIQETARKVWFLNPLPQPINWFVGAGGYISEPLIFLLYKRMPFMTGSQSARNDVVKFGIPMSNITIVPHGVLIKGKGKREKGKIRTIVYLGVLSKDKGIEDALRCFAILNKKGKYTFWVIGRPETKEYGEKIDKMANELRLKGKIKFWGFVPQSKKFNLLARAHILINPSLHEGWGLVNIEANAVGTPVVAYNVAGIVDSVKDGVNGIICKRNSAEELAKNVTKILNDEKLFKKLQNGSLSWSKKFSWERSKKLSLSLIEQIANTK